MLSPLRYLETSVYSLALLELSHLSEEEGHVLGGLVGGLGGVHHVEHAAQALAQGLHGAAVESGRVLPQQQQGRVGHAGHAGR